jgi:hypothetical protein
VRWGTRWAGEGKEAICTATSIGTAVDLTVSLPEAPALSAKKPCREVGAAEVEVESRYREAVFPRLG